MENIFIAHRSGCAMTSLFFMFPITFIVLSFMTNLFEDKPKKGFVIGIILIISIILGQGFLDPLFGIFALLGSSFGCILFTIVERFSKNEQHKNTPS